MDNSQGKDVKLNTHPSALISRHLPAILIGLAFIVLAIIYSLVTPPFEAGDESRHYAVVKYMADTGRLPVQQPGEAQIHWSHEGNQPPLYYALAAALTCWIDTGDWDDVYWYNPHTSIGDPLRPDNKNITIHPPGESWPWRHHILAVHLIRFLSIGMATVTVLTAYAIALNLFTGNRWLAAGAMALTAFNPMFIFISASVNNDNAVIMFVTLALGLMTQGAGRKSQVAGGRGQVAGGRWQVISGGWQVISGGWQGAGRRKQVAGDREQGADGRGQVISGGWQVAALLGLLIGLGALSKLYALGLIPLAVIFFFWLAYQADRRPIRQAQGRLPTHSPSSGQAADRSEAYAVESSLPAPRSSLFAPRLWRHFLSWTLMMLVVSLSVAGWFYLRNAVLYQGDVLALQVMRDTAGQRTEAPRLATLRAEFEGFRIAYWALFGGINILADPWIYKVLDWVSLIAAGGVIAFIIRFTTLAPERSEGVYELRFNYRASRTTLPATPVSLPTFAILLAWYLIMAAGFIAWNLTQPAGQGRLLYPAIAAISALGMLGLTWWLSRPAQKFVAVGCSLSLFVLALLAPFLYIAPAYAKPPILTRADLPADLQPVGYVYAGKMRLIGYRLPVAAVRPAETLPLTLYWELLEPTKIDYSIFVHLLGRQRQKVGQLDTYPGGGYWPTTLLSPGDILADHYEVPIMPQAEFTHAPTRLLIAAGIYDLHEPDRPGQPATDNQGRPVEPIIATAKLVPWQWPDPPRADQPINFADRATLLSYQIAPDQQSITLNWQAIQPFDSDDTVFIQLWRADTHEYVTGFDGPPVQGDYPTSLWAPAEIIVDIHPIDLSTLPVGKYDVWVGLYNPATGQRLPAVGPDGPLPDDAVKLGTVQVTGSK